MFTWLTTRFDKWFYRNVKNAWDNKHIYEAEDLEGYMGMNQQKKKPHTLKDFMIQETVVAEIAYENVVGQDSITRFDKNKNQKRNQQARPKQQRNPNPNNQPNQQRPKQQFKPNQPNRGNRNNI
jgi:hypothetical protein